MKPGKANVQQYSIQRWKMRIKRVLCFLCLLAFTGSALAQEATLMP
jgi:hypothetical protein